MKLIFNDATEIVVQQVESHGDYLRILTVGNTPEQLKVLFTDSSRTARMIVQERGQTVAAYEGYTAFYRTEIYTGKIYGVVMYKQETLPETQSQMIQPLCWLHRCRHRHLMMSGRRQSKYSIRSGKM